LVGYHVCLGSSLPFFAKANFLKLELVGIKNLHSQTISSGIVQTFASFKGIKKEDDASEKKYIWNCPK
jgi:hypothetical protein